MTAPLLDAPSRRVTIRPAPRREPPFDDELSPRHLRLVGVHDQPLPFEPVAAPRSATRTVHVPVRDDLPDPAVFGRRLLIATLEALAGRRPPQQLTLYVSQPVFARLFDARRQPLGAARAWRGGATVRSVHAGIPAQDVAELAAVVEVGGRVRAAAIRLEARDGRWRCTRLQLG